MPQARLDRWLGLVLLLFALGWSWIVVETIPTSPETGVTGPRVFPLMLGMLLGAFGLFTLASGIINSGRTEVRQDKVEGAKEQIASGTYESEEKIRAAVERLFEDIE